MPWLSEACEKYRASTEQGSTGGGGVDQIAGGGRQNFFLQLNAYYNAVARNACVRACAAADGGLLCMLSAAAGELAGAAATSPLRILNS